MRNKWTSKINEDPLLSVDLIAVLLVGTVRFTRIFKRTLEQCEFNAEKERLCDDLRSGNHSA